LLLKYAILALLLFVVVFILSYLSEKKILSRKTEYSDMKLITDKPEFEKEEERFYENQPSFLIYNRIPKCGSTTLLKLVKRLSARNNFDYIPSKIYNKERLAAEKLDEFFKFVKTRIDSGNVTFFNRHLFYTDMSALGPDVAYINLMREPVARFISGFYYLRAEEKKKEDSRIRTVGLPWTLWINKSLSVCVRNVSDPECSDFSNKRLHSWAGSWSRRFPTAMGYLCGNSENCEDATDIAARETAIDNIDNKFAVVGDSDNYEVTLAVLEHKLPRFFTGAVKEYQIMKREGVGVENQVGHPEATAEIIKMLEERMEEEVNVYRHVKKRLVKTCGEIPTCRAVMEQN